MMLLDGHDQIGQSEDQPGHVCDEEQHDDKRKDEGPDLPDEVGVGMRPASVAGGHAGGRFR